VTRDTMTRDQPTHGAVDHPVNSLGPLADPPDPTADEPVDHNPAWVAADPFRALVRHLLHASRLPVHHLAVKVGLPTPLCVRLLADPHDPTAMRGVRPIQRIPRDLAEQLMRTDAVGLCSELDVVLSAHRARAAIRELLADGHRLTTLARVTGLSLEALHGLAAGTTADCTGRVDTALQAARVWAETHPVDAPAAQAVRRPDRPGVGTARAA